MPDAPKVFLENKNTGKKYQIVKLDKATGEVVLRGPNAEFREKFDKERLKEMGYTLTKE